MSWPSDRFFCTPNAAHELLPNVGAVSWAVYATLTRMADRQGECFPSIETLAQKSGVSIRGAQHSVKQLKAAGLLAVERRYTGAGACRSSVYRLTPNPPTPKPEGACDADSAGGADSAQKTGGPRRRRHNPPAHGAPIRIPIEENPQEQDLLSTSEKLRSTDADREIASWMFCVIQERNPGHKSPDLAKWANSIRLTRERDGKTHDEIRSLFDFASKHDFWFKNILSPETLRKQWDRLILERQNPSGNSKPQRQRDLRGQQYTGEQLGDF